MDSRDGYHEKVLCRRNETVCKGKQYFSKDGTSILLVATGMDMHGAMAEDLFAFGC